MDSSLEFARTDEVRIAALAERKGSLMKTRQGHVDYPGALKQDTSKFEAPRTGEQAAEFLKTQHSSSDNDWYRMCLMLQRMARGIPALYPTAFAAMEATPESERVYKISDLRRGMIAYSDDPYDSNDAGHIYYIAGRFEDVRVLTWSNDVKRMGGVDMVPIEFYKNNWGDTFKFGATCLNGYDFSDFNAVPEPTKKHNTLGDRYEDALDSLKKIRRFKESKPGTERVVRILTRDITRMEEHLNKFSA
jgi:hypothetical protein